MKGKYRSIVSKCLADRKLDYRWSLGLLQAIESGSIVMVGRFPNRSVGLQPTSGYSVLLHNPAKGTYAVRFDLDRRYDHLPVLW